MRPKKNDQTLIKKGTLDQKHTERITNFDKMNRSIPNKKQKLVDMEDELDKLIRTNPNKYSHRDIRRKAQLMDGIDNLKLEINSIENCTESLNYIVNTLPILVNYYDNDQLVDDGFGEEMISEVVDGGKKNILSYFIQEVAKNKENEPIKPKRRSNRNVKKPAGSKTNNSGKKVSRAVLYENYLNATELSSRRARKRILNSCTNGECGGEKILSQNDGYLVCKKCGLSEAVLIPSDKPSYKEPSQDSGTYAYKRINHLTEILSQLQAKESTDIPPRVFESILRELKKRKIDKNELDIFRLRRILKKLNYRKYYEHVPHILQIINGKEPPNFSRKDEMRIKQMFRQIQKPFAIYCPKNRKNFLNYSYVLHKFCELLELDEYIGYFSLLKNNAKLLQHDKIWKNICGYMNWAFYKSI